MTDPLTVINATLWVSANMLVFYIALMLLVFVTAYQILFDPSATTAGKFVLRFAVSLIGVIGLVFISLFIDPRAGASWFQFPGDVIWWRPAIRFLAYSYVAYTVTALAVLLWLRKYRPEKLRVAPDENTLPVKLRRNR